MNIIDVKNEIVDIGKKLYSKDLTYGTSGNISVRVSQGFLITASGTALSDLNLEDIVLIDEHGNELEIDKKASCEKNLHLKIYNKRKDINAIIHCHAPTVSAFAVAHLDLDKPSMAENILYFGKIPLANYGMPSSSQLVENTVEKFDGHDVVLMANHGIIAGDVTLRHAFYKTETAEAYAKVTLYTKILGKEVLLEENDIADLENLKKSLKS